MIPLYVNIPTFILLLIVLIIGWIYYGRQIKQQYREVRSSNDGRKMTKGKRAIAWAIYTTIAASIYTFSFGGIALSTAINTHAVTDIAFYGAIGSGAIFLGRIGYGITSGAKGTLVIDIVSFVTMLTVSFLKALFVLRDCY